MILGEHLPYFSRVKTLVAFSMSPAHHPRRCMRTGIPSKRWGVSDAIQIDQAETVHVCETSKDRKEVGREVRAEAEAGTEAEAIGIWV
jgi:hypothetical protein